jgi:hypothetical protein
MGTVTRAVTQFPVVAIYGDGRVITQGAQIAIYPQPALPSVQVARISTADVDALVRRALDAGVDDPLDLGMPRVADAGSTTFTLVTDRGTVVKDVEALGVTSQSGDGLSADQLAGRRQLVDLLDALTDLRTTLGDGAVSDSEEYAPTAVAAIVAAWQEPPQPEPVSPAIAWPGPALPGEPLGRGSVATPSSPSCVAASGDQARAVLDAAGSATTLTPWTTDDGARWSITFRPLLPDESTCADLTR